jgi:hypothetical protein
MRRISQNRELRLGGDSAVIGPQGKPIRYRETAANLLKISGERGRNRIRVKT